MEELILVKPSLKHQAEYEKMMDEWEAYGGRLNPGALMRYSEKQAKNVPYDVWLKWVDEDSNKDTCPIGSVPQFLYFLVNGSDRILGAVSIRPRLNEALMNNGGHMGAGIRPSERMKGYATKMLSLSLPIAKNMGINRLLLTCDKDNFGSAKTIINNGGVLENTFIEENGNIVLRFWITL